MMKRVNLNEKIFKRIIKESVRKALNEVYIEPGDYPDNIRYDRFDSYEDLGNGLTKVCVEDWYNIIDNYDELICDRWYDEIGDFVDGCAKVMLYDKSGREKYNVIDTEGNELCRRWYDYISDFRNGYASVYIEGPDGYPIYSEIDTNGNELRQKFSGRMR